MVDECGKGAGCGASFHHEHHPAAVEAVERWVRERRVWSTVGKRQLVHGLSTRFVGRLHGFNAWWRGDLNLTGLFLTRQSSNNLRNPFILHPK